MFIADGHHRYETACNYRDHGLRSGVLQPDHPANYVLMQFVAMEDPGLLVLPTHRLFRGVPAHDGRGVGRQAGRLLHHARRPAKAPRRPETSGKTSKPAATRRRSGSFTQKDQQWTIARLTDAGRTGMAQIATDHGPSGRAGRGHAAPSGDR